MKLKDLIEVMYGDFTITAHTNVKGGSEISIFKTQNRFKDENLPVFLDRFGDYEVTSVINLSDGLTICCAEYWN